MPVRLRITLLFSAMVCIILLVVESTVYYVSHESRINLIKTRLKNRAVNTAGLLRHSEVFNSALIQKIDNSTSVSVRDKEIQVYDSANRKVYSYSDRPVDTIVINNAILRNTRQKGEIYFTYGRKEAIALYEKDIGFVVISATYDERGKKNLLQLKIILWLSLLGGVIISLVGGYLFSRKLLQPVRNIADEVNEISVKNLARRIRTGKSKDEWRHLAETLNSLLNRLQQSFEMQRRFISNASHELSTPLTSISNQLEVSLQRNRDALHYRNVMESVQQDVYHMKKLTQVLLEFAKASGSQGGLEIEPVRIDEIILRLPGELAKINASYVVKPGFENLPEDQSRLLVYGNEELLFIAVKNIVLNACKYTSDHQAIVRLKTLAGYIIIEIVDKGHGIAYEELENIFQPFYRTDNVATTQGFGLGLSLSSQIIKIHKGNITVSSEVDKGTIFTITLPSDTHQQN